MKALLGAVTLGVIAFLIWYGLISGAGQDKYVPIQMIYGNANERQVEVHANIGVGMFAADREYWQGQRKTADQWIADHFKLVDADGQPVNLDRQNHSNLFKTHQIVGTQEFFLVARLNCGEEYTYEYKPKFSAAEVYQYKFVAPAKAEKPATYNFVLVK